MVTVLCPQSWPNLAQHIRARSMTKGSGRVGRPPGPRPASARDVGRSDVRQFFPLAHLAPIFTQPMGGSSTHNDTAGSSREPIVISGAPSSAPTAAAACAAVLDTLGQFMEDYGSGDEDKPAAVGQDVNPEPVTSTTEPTQVNMDRMAKLRDTWTFKVRISMTLPSQGEGSNRIQGTRTWLGTWKAH